MTCAAEIWVLPFVSGRLADDDLSRFIDHLDACPRCLALVSERAKISSTAADAEGNDSEASDDSVWIHLIAAMARASDRAFAEEGLPRAPRERFGPYIVQSTLGRGAMGLVLSAVHDESKRVAAIKTILAPNTRSLEAIRQEIVFLRRVQHRGIVRIFEDGIEGGDPWYAMELLVGETLEQRKHVWWSSSEATRGDPPGCAPHLQEVLAIFLSLCTPLEFIHREGVVHCDLKPSNVFVRDDGEAVIMDFGLLSRAGGATGRETLEVGGLRGTVPYLAPELIRGRIPDARADLYSVGCMLYECLAGRPPFVAKTSHAVIDAHLHEKPARLSTCVAGVPAELEALVLTLLEKRADRRLGSAFELAERLARMLPPGPVSPPVAAKPYLFRPRLVGRDDVMERFDRIGARVRHGHGQVVFLSGESGIGKTFLASELAARAIRQGFDVVTGECEVFVAPPGSQPLPATTPFAPFRRLLQRAADRSRPDLPASDARPFASLLTLRVLAPFEPALASVLGEGGDSLPDLPGPAQRARTLEAMRDLMAQLAADRPLLLVVDDFQWADDLSNALIDSLSPEFLIRTAVLVVALCRSDDAFSLPEHVRGKEQVEVIRLARLGSPALEEIVADMLALRLPPPVMEALTIHADGNPFFLAEYVRAAVTDGVLVRSPEGWQLADSVSRAESIGRLVLPKSLRDLLGHRLDALGIEACRLLEVAAVIGRDVPSNMLGAVAQVSEPALASLVGELSERELVEPTPGGGLRFAHDKVREFAYERMDPSLRQAAHLAAAAAIEKACPSVSELSARSGDIAHHLARGGAVGRAIDFFERAAEHALQRSANSEAVRFFDEATRLCAIVTASVAVERRASWERRSGEALHGLGDLSGSRDRLARALALLGQAVPERPAALSLGIGAKLAAEVGSRLGAPWRARRIPEARKRSLEIARAYDRLMQIYYYRGEYGPLLHANLATLHFAQRSDVSPTLAVAYSNMAATAGIIPIRPLANLYFRLAHDALERAYDPEVDSYFHLLHGSYLTGLGDRSPAVGAADRVMSLAGDLGFRRRWEEGAALRYQLAWGVDFEACLEWSNRMSASAAGRSDDQVLCWGLLSSAEVHVTRGEIALAEPFIRRAEAGAAQLGAPERIRLLALRALVSLGEGAVGEAVEAGQQVNRLITATSTVHVYCITAYAIAAQVQLELSRRGVEGSGDGVRLAYANLRSAARIFPVARPIHFMHAGDQRVQAGDLAGAVASWRRGREASVEFGTPLDTALLDLRLARHGALSPDGGAAAEEAMQTLRHLRMRGPESHR